MNIIVSVYYYYVLLTSPLQSLYLVYRGRSIKDFSMHNGRGAGTIVYVGGDQSININVVVKVGWGGDQYIGGSHRF